MLRPTLFLVPCLAVFAACASAVGPEYDVPDALVIDAAVRADGDAAASERASWELLGDVPYPRRGHASIYDPVRRRLLVTGGNGNDTWSMAVDGPDAGDWARVNAAGEPPPASTRLAAIYDPSADRMVLLVDQAQAWSLALGESPRWSRLLIASSDPAPARSDSVRAVYDPDQRRMLVVTAGGSDEVWALSLGAPAVWTRVAAAPRRGDFGYGPDAVYDTQRHRVIVFPRGRGSDFFALSLAGTPVWARASLSGGPSWSGGSAIYDAQHDRVVVSAWRNRNPGLFALPLSEPMQWQQLAADRTADPQYGQTAIYVPGADGRMITFGGYVGGDGSHTVTNETRAITLGSTPASSLLGRTQDRFDQLLDSLRVYDPARSRLLAIAGYQGGGAMPSPTRAFALQGDSRWSTLLLEGTAPGQAWGCAVHDPLRHETAVFGGQTGGYHNELYLMSDSATTAQWSRFAETTPRPSQRIHPAAVYDGASRRMVVFGGQITGIGPARYLNDVWTVGLDRPQQWSRLEPAGTPPSPRAATRAVFDSARRRMIVAGGANDMRAFDDLWELSLGDAPRWTQIDALGSPPPLSGDYASVYDVAADRVLVFSASREVRVLRAWALTLAGRPTWRLFCEGGERPLAATRSDDTWSPVVWTPRGAIVSVGASVWRFDPASPYCP